jgi:folate-binding protein YgfZ
VIAPRVPELGEAFAARIARDVVRVAGPDAATYLQGQVSQDVSALTVGDSAWSFVLQPQGKVDAWFRITRTAEDTYVLDVEGGWGDALVRRLERFKLRVKVTIEQVPWQCVAVRGVLPDLAALRATGAEVLVPLDWGSEIGVDLLGPAVEIPTGVHQDDDAAYEQWRVRVGMPRMGAELDERTIPAETGVVDRSVSFTKGCYTGQELVARVDSRGSNTPRKLRALVVDAAAVEGGPVAAGDTLVVDGHDVGVVTSSAGARALAYVRREIDPPAVGTVGGASVRVELLPGP